MPERHDYYLGYKMNCVVTQFGEVRDRGKSKKAVREVSLGEYAFEDIKNQREMKRRLSLNSEWLFCNAYGRKLNPKVMSDTFRKFADIAGSDLTLYELRHTMISILPESTPEKALKDSVGHSESMKTGSVYDHALKKEKQQLPAIIDAAFDDFHGQANPKAKIINIRK